MPLSVDDHLDDLTRHIDLVRNACVLLGRRLIDRGRLFDGQQLIARGFRHDVSKFSGIEWEYMHAGADTPPDRLELARLHHTATNDHHPEFWSGINRMSELAVYEMVCDWFARAQEMGTSLREWVETEAVRRYGLDWGTSVGQWVRLAMDLLLQTSFVKPGGPAPAVAAAAPARPPKKRARPAGVRAVRAK